MPGGQNSALVPFPLYIIHLIYFHFLPTFLALPCFSLPPSFLPLILFYLHYYPSLPHFPTSKIHFFLPPLQRSSLPSLHLVPPSLHFSLPRPNLFFSCKPLFTSFNNPSLQSFFSSLLDPYFPSLYNLTFPSSTTNFTLFTALLLLPPSIPPACPPLQPSFPPHILHNNASLLPPLLQFLPDLSL